MSAAKRQLLDELVVEISNRYAACDDLHPDAYTGQERLSKDIRAIIEKKREEL